MLYVGIDVSADKFHVAIYYPDSKSFKLLSFPQSRHGFDDFKSVLLSLNDDLCLVRFRASLTKSISNLQHA